MINPFCGLSVIFCGFISHPIGRKTINIPEIFSSVHGFTGKTVKLMLHLLIKSEYEVKIISAYLNTMSDIVYKQNIKI